MMSSDISESSNKTTEYSSNETTEYSSNEITEYSSNETTEDDGVNDIEGSEIEESTKSGTKNTRKSETQESSEKSDKTRTMTINAPSLKRLAYKCGIKRLGMPVYSWVNDYAEELIRLIMKDATLVAGSTRRKNTIYCSDVRYVLTKMNIKVYGEPGNGGRTGIARRYKNNTINRLIKSYRQDTLYILAISHVKTTIKRHIPVGMRLQNGLVALIRHVLEYKIMILLDAARNVAEYANKITVGESELDLICAITMSQHINI
jgi:histone H3/H4